MIIRNLKLMMKRNQQTPQASLHFLIVKSSKTLMLNLRIKKKLKPIISLLNVTFTQFF